MSTDSTGTSSKKPPMPAVDTEKKIPQLKKQPLKVSLDVSTAETNSLKLAPSMGVKPRLAASSVRTVTYGSEMVASTTKSQHEQQSSQVVQAQMQARYQGQLREEDLEAWGIDESADLSDTNPANIPLLLSHRISY
jgi:hypothetical protein